MHLAVRTHTATDPLLLLPVRVQAGTPVWQLLCERLEKSPQLWGDRLLKLKARWQQQVTDLQQQLEQTRAVAQQQSADLQQQVAEARQQSALLQERLADLQRQVAQQQQQQQRASARRRRGLCGQGLASGGRSK